MNFRAILVAPVVALTFVAGACSESPAPTSPTAVSSLAANAEGARTRSAPAPIQPAQNFEVKFLTGMIDHHAMAVAMAQICLQKAVHTELRDMCQQIITAQTQDIALMQSWLQDWYGISYRPVTKPGDQRMLERLSSLSGAGFEIEFMEMMIKHHERAIKESRQCLDKAWHPELRQICQNIITTQSAEIAQLQSWLCQWFGRCK